MKKIFAIILSISLMVCMIPATAFAAWYDSNAYISTETQLSELATAVNNGSLNSEGKTYTLSADITISGGWTPIGTDSNPFKGTFNGAGHNITGLSDSLFGTVSGATINNINLLINRSVGGPAAVDKISDPASIDTYTQAVVASGTDLNGSSYYVSSGAGYVAATGTAVDGTTYYTKNSGAIKKYSELNTVKVMRASTTQTGQTQVINGSGGLVGTIDGTANLDTDKFKENIDATKIIFCSNAVSVTTTEAVAGGLVGQINSAAILQGSSNSGAVTVTNGSAVAGGLVGSGEEVLFSANNTNNNSGAVIAYSSGTTAGGTVGGIIGQISEGTVQNVSNTAALTGTVKGNIVGEAKDSVLLKALGDSAANPVVGTFNGSFIKALSMKFIRAVSVSEYSNIELSGSSMDVVNAPKSLVLSGGSAATINSGNNTVSYVISDCAVTNITSGNRTQGNIRVNTTGSGKVTNVTAKDVTLSSPNGTVGTVYLTNSLALDGGGQLPTKIVKYESAFAAAEKITLFGSLNVTETKYESRNPKEYHYTFNYEAKIGNKNYASLDNALVDAANGETVTVLANSTVNGITVDAAKKVTLDLNGKTITVNNIIQPSGELIVKSTGTTGTLLAASEPSIPIGGKLTLYAGRFKFDTSVSGFNIYNCIPATSSVSYSSTTKYYTVTNDMKISGCKVTVTNLTYAYDGTAKTPKVIVADPASDTPLVEGTDYYLGYSNNINVGRATVTIYGRGAYKGSTNGYFTIIARDLYNTTVDPIDNQGYTGTQVRPQPIIKDGKTTLKLDTDYTLTYGTNVNIGSGSVTIKGKGNYVGTRTVAFTIAKNINNCSFSGVNDYEYTGKPISPSVTVYDGTTKLSQNLHYKLEYGTNTYAGEATVTVIGIGAYGGSRTISFRILGEEQKITARWNSFSKLLTSSTFNLGAKALGNAKLYYVSLNPDIATVDSLGNVTIKDTGIAKIRISSAVVGAYGPDEKIVTVKIRPNKAKFYAVKPAKRQLKVRITKQQGATKYQIKWATNKSFRSSKNYYVTHSTNTAYVTQAKTLKTLRSGSVYYIKVRAYKTMPDGTKVWGTWSDVRAYRVK